MNRAAPLDPFEARLRAVMVDLRPTEGAPSTLRASADAIPEQVGPVGVLARARAAIVSPGRFATLAALVVLVAAAASLKPVFWPAIDAGQGPATLALDPTIEGPGIIRDPIPTLLIVQALTVLLALVLARRWRSIGSFDSWRDMARGLTLIVLLAGAALALQPGIADKGGSADTALGYELTVNPPPGSDGPTVYYESAEPGAPMIVFFDVTNVSALPITLEGFVPIDGNAGPRWTALAVATSRDVFPNDMAHLRPFSPQVIQPGELFTVYLVGKAGACAYGPGYTLDTVGVTRFASLTRNVELVYSTLGLSTRTTVQMPMQLVEPSADHCP